jgi:GNAT superfamily N-acetyltransferase
MLDKNNMPLIGVIMEKYDTKNYPKVNLPRGYYFSPYKSGYENEWCKLQFRLEQTDSLDEANEIFQREFMSRPDEMKIRCVFVCDDKDNVIATASLWDGKHFGKTLQRVHWVAVSYEYQGKGIAKALLTKVLDIYDDLGYRNYIYLTSQTWSYKAINIYKAFGFKPYIGKKPKNYKAVNMVSDYEEKNKEAWNIITDKINLYQKK